MAISRAASQAAAAEAAAEQEAFKKRAARQAASVMLEPETVDNVSCRVLKLGDGKISMGVHVAGIGDAFYEKGETFTLPRDLATGLEDRGMVEISEVEAVLDAPRRGRPPKTEDVHDE